MAFRFEDLQVWQRALDLDEQINQLTKYCKQLKLKSHAEFISASHWIFTPGKIYELHLANLSRVYLNVGCRNKFGMTYKKNPSKP